MVSHLAAQAEFRQTAHSKTQEATLDKLVSILKTAPMDPTSRESSHLHIIFRNVCEAMTNVLRDQKDAKKVIQDLGGIPHLVRLLSSVDTKVQRASTSVLRTLAFKEDNAKQAIVECGAVQPLIRMLRSEVCTYPSSHSAWRTSRLVLLCLVTDLDAVVGKECSSPSKRCRTMQHTTKQWVRWEIWFTRVRKSSGRYSRKAFCSQSSTCCSARAVRACGKRPFWWASLLSARAELSNVGIRTMGTGTMSTMRGMCDFLLVRHQVGSCG